MTSTEYRDVLDLLALTQAEMAELLGVSIRTAHGYANGARIRLRAGGDIKVLTRCVAVCAVAYRDLAEGARHRIETDLLVARNRAERARDVTPPADAGEDSDPAALAVYAHLRRMATESEERARTRSSTSEF